MDFLASPLKGDFKWPALDTSTVKLPSDTYKAKLNVDLVDMRRAIGIEVEVENIRKRFPYDPCIWFSKEDGSLRNNGWEYVTYPVIGTQIKYAIETLFEGLPDTADFSDRTSIHIHVNVRDYTYENVLNVILLYTVFERLLYRYAGPQRYKNIFCIPIQETKLPIAIANFLVNKDFITLIREWQKYSGMNLLCIRNFGTIEYRHMEGNRDQYRILNWINLLLSIHKFAKEIKFIDLFDQIQKLNSNSYYELFLRTVFKDNFNLLYMPILQQEMEYGVSTVKSISLPSAFLTQLFQDISNESPLLKSLGVSQTMAITTKPKELLIMDDPLLRQQEVPIDWNMQNFLFDNVVLGRRR